MPSRIDEAGHTKAFDFPVAEHWGQINAQNTSQIAGKGALVFKFYRESMPP